MYDKPIGNIILNDEKLKARFLILGTRQGCPLLLFFFFFFKHIIGIPSHSNQIIKKKKKKKKNLNWKGNSKTVFAGNMILYLENPTDDTPELLELINEFSKVSGYKKRKKEIGEGD